MMTVDVKDLPPPGTHGVVTLYNSDYDIKTSMPGHITDNWELAFITTENAIGEWHEINFTWGDGK